MAFVYRTTRETCRIDGFVPETNCTQDIGPGHYDVETGTAMLRDRTKASSRAPFLSTSLRDTPQRGKANLGPGEYYDATKRPETLGVGCQGAFKSRTKRFQDSNRDKASMPAPGQYEVCQSPPARPPKVKDFGRDTEIFAAFDHEATAPSIPAGDLSHGYVVDSEGKIRPRRRASSARGRGPGPGEYSGSAPTWSGARGAVAFDKQAPRTVGQRPNAVPGPGHYHKESAGENQHTCALLNPTLADFVRPSLHSSFASTSQRTSGAPKAAAEMPGPGQYAIHELSSKQWIKGSPNVRAKGFGSTSSRFNDPACRNDDDEFGGPDFMPPKSSFVDTWQRASTAQQVHRPGVGFCSSSARIPESKKATEGPGIGNYRLPGMVDDLMLNLATGPKRKKAPFGSSSCRFRRAPAKVHKDDTEQKARLRAIERRRRAHSSRAKTLASRESKAYASVFASKTRRWSGARAQSGPDPGAYDVDRVQSLAADLARKGATTHKGIMESSGDRFRAARSEDADVPGPGQYYKGEPMVAKAKRRGAGQHRAHPQSPTPRRQGTACARDSTPGPGQYNLSDAASSFLKPTYNLSIAVEEEQALRRLGYLP